MLDIAREERYATLSDAHDTVPDCLDDGLDIYHRTNTEPVTTLPTNMCSEDSRLRTFHNWPSDWGKKLAGYGFYSISRSGYCVIRCAFCGLELSEFSSPQDASLQHWKEARQRCGLLKGEDVGNISSEELTESSGVICTDVRTSRPMVATSRPTYSALNLKQHVSGLTDDPVIHTEPSLVESLVPSQTHDKLASKQDSFRQQSVPSFALHLNGSLQHSSDSLWAELVRTARYPDMSSYQARLHTLRKWPLIRPSPQELAKAGFFHVRCQPSTSDHEPWVSTKTASRQTSPRKCHQDSVKCFWCCERIHRWQETDDPLLEHARLSPGCRFVSHIIGQQLHDDIVRSSRASSGQENCRLETEEENTSPSPTQQYTAKTLTPSKLDSIMESSKVQTVLQMGFPRELIRDLLSLHSEQLSAETLCHLALETTHNTSGLQQASSSSRSTGNGGHDKGDDGQKRYCADQTRSSQAKESPATSLTAGNVKNFSSAGEWSVILNPLEEFREHGEKLTCKVCADAEVTVMFRPCNHLVCCKRCAALFTSCPVCQCPIEDILIPHLT